MAEEMKCCSKCGEEKPVASFCRDKTRHDELHPWCRECRSAQGRKYYSDHVEEHHARTVKWRAENPDRQREINKKSHKNNKIKRNSYSRKYRTENEERMRELGRNWAKNNPDKCRDICAKRRAAKHSATPIWASTEFEEFVMSEMYDLAVSRKKATGFDWHVDHIVPLKSKKVCGLHCVANLRVIPSLENHRKGNRTWPDMWKATPKGP